jgi:hypothetical protein
MIRKSKYQKYRYMPKDFDKYPYSLPQKQLPTDTSPPRQDQPQAQVRPAAAMAGQLTPAQILRRRKRQLQRENQPPKRVQGQGPTGPVRE